MGNRRAALIQAAQATATQYSLPTKHLLETLVREVSCDHTERVLELARRIDDECHDSDVSESHPGRDRRGDPSAPHDGVA